MATVCSAAPKSVPPSHRQLPDDNSRFPILNSILPICKQKLANRRPLCPQGRLDEAPKLLQGPGNNGGSRFSLDNFTCNNDIVGYFGKHDRLDEAQRVFDEMPHLNEVSWSTIIASYAYSGNLLRGLLLFVEMAEEGIRPNSYALRSLLKATSSPAEIGIGRQLHGWLIRAGFLLDGIIRASLITMYSNCGFLNEAQRAFNEVNDSSLDDVLVLNSILSAYILHEHWVEAFHLFVHVLSAGLVAPTEHTYAILLNACGLVGAVNYGKTLHGRIVKGGLIDATIMGNSLVTFYAKTENLACANRLFEKITRKDVVSWNAIIAGNEQNSENETAIDLFHRMLMFGPKAKPNRVTFLSVLSAISGVSALNYGRQIHGHIFRSGLEQETSIANSLITMYSKCGEVCKARVVFERLPFKDVITWNSLLAGYEQNEEWESCFELFNRMLSSGIEPDDYSFTVILDAASSDSSNSKYLRQGRGIHGYLLKKTSPLGSSVSTCNALLKLYANCSGVEDAEKIFNRMSAKDAYSWNAMMDGYSINGRCNDAIMVFLNMHDQGLPADHLAFSILLTVCGRLVSLEMGKQFHAFIIKYYHHHHYTYQTSLLSINNALISMYSKCGSITDAAQVFSRMTKRDIFSWTAIISGYAYHGMAYESLQHYDKMKQDGFKPNPVTFLGLLTACAHAGLIEEGTYYFRSMREEHDLNPTLEHYACMIDLFSRSGQFESAAKFVEAANFLNPDCADTLSLWKVLLGSCHAQKQLKLGIHIARRILELEPENETIHILLSNLYASSGMWEDVAIVRKWMKEKGLTKEVGCSWIDAGNRRHLFAAGDVSHPWRKEIYEKLEELDKRCRATGYVPMTEYVLHDVEETQKEAIISYHSEKLAVSFGLLQSGPRSKRVIRVIKNIRICGDCHNWMKYVSQVEGREILLRDSRRFHFFKEGRCSCRDYW
ncbi:PREDICTED: pentatricopeptide repeat-containing protein At2g33760-like [Nelumbo nucifera]|uniref:Pentatricopeptide repeat-containing protein At2g33760-like n=2 Tax=Nelumbo nucifera TaxID=4432 RepID=A0A1U8BBK4_NELNU|nr:PREDICTED: pentatricopeptide repeat-containing protein At2g33760-like [Nelumbo nucifera]DAD21406.1 TPA_asm: hypothetical protein HUJ06_022869 [Nelumbo nucifera]